MQQISNNAVLTMARLDRSIQIWSKISNFLLANSKKLPSSNFFNCNFVCRSELRKCIIDIMDVSFGSESESEGENDDFSLSLEQMLQDESQQQSGSNIQIEEILSSDALHELEPPLSPLSSTSIFR
jgi:hypothetical protein